MIMQQIGTPHILMISMAGNANGSSWGNVDDTEREGEERTSIIREALRKIDI